MFDIGWSELMVIGVVALVVIGPKDLPGAIYALGKWVRKARLMARDFQGHLDDMMREAELNDLRQQALKARDSMNFGNVIDKTVDPDGRLKHVFDLEVKDTSQYSDAAAAAAAAGAGTPTVPGTGAAVGSGAAAFDVSAAGATGHAGSPPEPEPEPEPVATPAPVVTPAPAAPAASDKPATDRTA